MKRLILHPEAKADIAEAISFYACQRRGLGREFRTTVDRALQQIRPRPLAYPKHLRTFRKKTLPRFPYTIYFAVREDRILIVAVAHQRCQPDYWTERSFET